MTGTAARTCPRHRIPSAPLGSHLQRCQQCLANLTPLMTRSIPSIYPPSLSRQTQMSPLSNPPLLRSRRPKKPRCAVRRFPLRFRLPKLKRARRSPRKHGASPSSVLFSNSPASSSGHATKAKSTMKTNPSSQARRIRRPWLSRNHLPRSSHPSARSNQQIKIPSASNP